MGVVGSDGWEWGVVGGWRGEGRGVTTSLARVTDSHKFRRMSRAFDCVSLFVCFDFISFFIFSTAVAMSVSRPDSLQSVCLPVCPSVSDYVCPSVCLDVCLFVRLFLAMFMPVCLLIYICLCLPACLSLTISVCLSVCLRL